jgi:hypothetical protein
VHHIVHREHGGSHDVLNCVLLCSACHLAHHRGLLAISGTADRLVVRRPTDVGPAKPRPPAAGEPTIEHVPRAASPVVDGTADAIASAHVGASKLDMAILETQAKAALVGLGWKPAIARLAVAAALSECGNDVALERLIVESLRRCPVPRG